MWKKLKNDNFSYFFKSDLGSAKSLPAAGQPAVRMKAGQERLRGKFQFSVSSRFGLFYIRDVCKVIEGDFLTLL
jgi:hypothetical protein